jgi:hypothetical protein
VEASDLLVCLVRANAQGRSGGTNDLLERALKAHKPVLDLRVMVQDGQPVLEESWHLGEGVRWAERTK